MKAILIKRLHSLLGVFPISVFLINHIFINALAIVGKHNGKYVYDKRIEELHSLPYLLIIEIVFIFAPILLHILLGLWITTKGNLASVKQYGYFRNWMYVLQRITGIILVVFIVFHVIELRIKSGGDVNFRFVSDALEKPGVMIFYVIGLASTCFHFGNGLWSFLVTWGVTVGKRSQKVASVICLFIGVIVFAVSMHILIVFVS